MRLVRTVVVVAAAEESGLVPVQRVPRNRPPAGGGGAHANPRLEIGGGEGNTKGLHYWMEELVCLCEYMEEVYIGAGLRMVLVRGMEREFIYNKVE